MPEKISNLNLFTGDFFLRRRKIDSFINQILSKENRAFHLFRIDLKETTFQNFLFQVRSHPMLGEKQIFWIDDISQLKKDNLAMFEEYFKSPVKWSYFILETGELESENAVTKLVAKYGTRIDSLENEKRSGIHMIHEKFKSANVTITKEAWQYLEEKTGGNLVLLSSCVEKLLLYTEDEKKVELEIAKKLADEFIAFDAFDLTNAICEKNVKKALKIFQYLYELEGDGIAVVGLLHWQLKQIWQAKVIKEERGEREVAKALQISPYRLPHLIRQASGFSFEDLEHTIQKLFLLDWKSKTGALNSKIALEALIIDLASPKKEKKYLLSGISG